MWQQLDLHDLFSGYVILLYPFLLLLLISWLPMPYFWFFGRWKRW